MKWIFTFLIILLYVYIADRLARYISQRTEWNYNLLLILLLLFGPLLGLILILLTSSKKK